jgi:hypothetical protein
MEPFAMLVRVNLDEVPPVIDVHPPHEPIHGWRDFLLHLTTITIGLLIALSLEGLVEWQHHRHLVHEAEASLHAEIQANANKMPGIIANLQKHENEIKNDIATLQYIQQNHKKPEHYSGFDLGFNFQQFADEGWKTAQSTDALSYMPYARAQEYGLIYGIQADFITAQQQATRDLLITTGSFANDVDDHANDPTGGQAGSMKDKIGALQGELWLVDTHVQVLDKVYKDFLAAHPN